jgi:hypothetical protein
MLLFVLVLLMDMTQPKSLSVLLFVGTLLVTVATNVVPA